MASFSQNIPGKYGVKSYQDTKNTYDWIIKSLNKGEFQNLKIETDFLFDISEITCSCKGINEFVEHAYGQNNYSFISMNFNIESKGTSIWFISVNCSSQVRISTDTKSLLEKTVDLLNNTSLDETEVDDPISVTYIEHQDNSVTINGDSNMVANNHSTVLNTQGKTKSKTSEWLQGVFQGVLANGIWKILGVLAAVIAAFVIGKSI